VPETNAPASEQIPKSGGSGPYILGAIVLLLLMGGLLYWKTSGSTPEAPKPVATQTQAPLQVVEPPPPPPPPPPPVEEDAGVDAGDKKVSGTKTGSGDNGACSKCGEGTPSTALQSALSQAAGGARGCYQRALRTTEASGSMTVSVQVGSQGQVCGASITKDTVGSSDISSCVLGKFRGRSFPPPQSGCVVVNIPISFSIKQ
jgi:hypothetical protein